MLKSIQLHKSGKWWLICIAALILFLNTALPVQANEFTMPYKGLTLNANLELAEGKTLQDGVVIVLHGSMAHNRMEIIEASQQALADNDQSSLAINLSLGVDNRHGFYDCSLPHRHTSEGGVDELGAWVAWLREKGVAGIVIMAHSRGANQAMVYAVEAKNPAVTHLVLIAPNTSPPKPQYEARFGEIYDENIERVQKQIDAGKGGELIENLDFLYCPRASVSADSFNSYNGVDDKFRQFQMYLPQVQIPTLIVTGTRDEIEPDIVEDLAPYADGRRIRIGVIENAGHFFQDFNIEEAVEAAVEFIAESG
jgi:pimeloyl-ACP methyl ester carboxylesterase